MTPPTHRQRAHVSEQLLIVFLSQLIRRLPLLVDLTLDLQDVPILLLSPLEGLVLLNKVLPQRTKVVVEAPLVLQLPIGRDKLDAGKDT